MIVRLPIHISTRISIHISIRMQADQPIFPPEFKGHSHV